MTCFHPEQQTIVCREENKSLKTKEDALKKEIDQANRNRAGLLEKIKNRQKQINSSKDKHADTMDDLNETCDFIICPTALDQS